MALVMLKLGSFSFGVDTAAYSSFSRNDVYKWASQAVVGKAPRNHFMGPGETTQSLPGVIYPSYAGGLGQVPEMRKLAGKGEPLLMVDGYGNVCGYWFIKSVRETGKSFLPGGAPRRIDFSLELGFYGEQI